MVPARQRRRRRATAATAAVPEPIGAHATAERGKCIERQREGGGGGTEEDCGRRAAPQWTLRQCGWIGWLGGAVYSDALLMGLLWQYW